MKEISDIKNEIKKSKKTVFWYNENSKEIIVGDSKSKTKNKIKSIKYTGKLFRLSISFHKGTGLTQGGPIAVKVNEYYKENDKIKKIPGWKNGYIWFNREWLEINGWKQRYLDIIIEKMLKKFEFRKLYHLYHHL